MAEQDEQPNPVDQLVDLFVYAPVGLLYEYQDVLPKLVKRGKSQVKLARVVGQMAMNRGSADSFNVLAEGLAGMVARQITDIGAAIGLAPSEESDESPEDRQPPPPTAALPPGPAADGAAEDLDTGNEAGRDTAASEPEARPLPIARYDDLTAKEVIELLGDLEPTQLGRIRSHESSGKARKTVLAKIDRLVG